MSLDRYFPYPSQTAIYVGNISDRYRYFYLANPKVASTGILRALQFAEVNGDTAQLPEIVHNRERSPLLDFTRSVASADEILQGEQYFRFTYVRNPFTRVLSAYLEKVLAEPLEKIRLLPTLGLPANSSPTFLDFLKAIHGQRDGWRDIHWATQSRLIQSNNIPYHYVGRFESFEHSFPKLLERMGIPKESHKSSTQALHATGAGKRLREFFGPAERDLVLTIYEADFNNFRYGADPLVAAI
jgi:hypothetical protein